MGFWKRHFPKIVSLTGSLGLGLSGAYLFGVALMFVPGFQKWVDFFIVWGPPLVMLPGGMLIAHLYLRTHLGGWLVDQQRDEEAIRYTRQRLEPSLMRGRRETVYHRIYLSRAHIYRGEYEEALETLSRGYARPMKGAEALMVSRWMLEAGLRLEWEEAIGQAVDGLDFTSGRAGERAAVEACLAEWAVLEDDREAHETHLEEGRWADATETRLDLAEAIGLQQFGRGTEEYHRALDLLGEVEAEANHRVPGRRAELRARRVDLLVSFGRVDEAESLLGEQELEGDKRSQRIVSEVRQRIAEHRE